MRYLGKAAALVLPMAIVLGAGALAVLRMGGVGVIARSTVEDAISQALGRDVKVASARVGLDGSLTLRDVRVDDSSGVPLALVSRITIRYAYRPGGSLLQNVQAVHIQDPVISLIRDQKGRWNIQDLLERLRPARPRAFGAGLTISGGKVKISDRASRTLREIAFSDLQADVQFSSSAQARFAASVRGPEGLVGVVSATGGFRPGGGEATISATGLAISPVVSRFVPREVARATSGSAAIRAHLSASEKHGWRKPDYVVVADVRGCDLRIPQVREPIRHLSGRFLVVGRNVRAESASASIGGGRVQFSGALMDWKRPALQVSAAGAVDLPRALRAFGLRKFPRQVRIRGPVEFSARLGGPLSNLSVTGSARAAGASLGPVEVEQAEADMSYAAGRLWVTGLAARAAGGLVEGDGWVSFGRSPQAIFRGQARGIDVGPMLAKLEVQAPASGKVEGPVWLSWQPGGIRIAAHASLTEGRAYGLPLRSAYVRASREKEQLVIERASASSPCGVLEASGRFSDGGALDIQFAASDVDLAQVGAASGQEGLSGQANVWGRITGTLKQPTVDGHAYCVEPKFKQQGVDLLSGHFVASREALRVSEATAYWRGNELGLSGALTGVDWSKRQAQVDFRVESERISLADLVEAAGIKTQAVGAVGASLTIAGRSDDIRVHGEGRATDSFLAGQHIRSARASFEWQEGSARLSDLRVELPSSEIAASGAITRQGEAYALDFRFEAPSLNLADLDMNSLAGVGLDVSGRASASGRIGGTNREPLVEASMESPSFAVNGSRFADARVEASLKGDTLIIKEMAVSQAGGRYSAAGSVDTRRRTCDLTLSVTDGDLAAIRSAAEGTLPALGENASRVGARLASLPRPFGGRLNATATIAGPLREPRGSVSMTATHMTIAQRALPDVEASASFEWPRFEIAEARATSGDAYAAASGTIDLEGNISLEIDGYNLSAGLLEPWLKPGVSITGTGDVSISVSGPTQSPVAVGSAEIGDFSAGSASFDRARVTRFDIDQSGLRMGEILLTKGPHHVAISGKVPFTWSRFRIPEHEPIEILMQLRDQDLALVEAFLPQARGWSGPLSGSLLIAGTPAQPVLREGFLKVSDGRMRLPGVGEIKQAAADVTLRENVATINRLQATAASGGFVAAQPGSTIRIDEISPRRFATNRFDVSVSVRDLMVRVGDVARGPVQANLHLTNGPDGAALLRGDITARPGWQVELGKASRAAQAQFQPWFDPNLDIALEIQPFVYVTSAAAELAMAGHGRVSGTAGRPAVSASLEGRRGWLLFPAARLRITFASAEIGVRPSAQGRLESRATLRLEGEAMVSNYQVFATLTGPVDNLSISRRSVPALADQQIDSLLTAGVLPAVAAGPSAPALSETAREVLMTGLGTVALSPLERRVASGLGLEELSVEFNYGEPVRVRAGTYVLGGPLKGSLYLSYVRSLAGKATTSLLRSTYQLSPSLHLGWSLDERSVSRIELQRTKRF